MTLRTGESIGHQIQNTILSLLQTVAIQMTQLACGLCDQCGSQASCAGLATHADRCELVNVEQPRGELLTRDLHHHLFEFIVKQEIVRPGDVIDREITRAQNGTATILTQRTRAPHLQAEQKMAIVRTGYPLLVTRDRVRG